MRLLLSSSLLLSALCLLASLGGSDAVCCTTMAQLEFTIANGHCGVVNAQRIPQGCAVTVCGDGTVLEGNFCGKGPCNMFGCNCEGGCRHGNYAQNFLARNQGIDIILMHSEIVNRVPSAQLTGAVCNAATGIIKKFTF